MNVSGRRLILIVEDNRDLAYGMGIILKSAGFDVETVHDGDNALRASHARTPDIVLLDIGLPGMNGFQVAEAMRRDPDLKGVKIIAMSGYDADMYPGRDDLGSFDRHMTKPVDFMTISAELERML